MEDQWGTGFRVIEDDSEILVKELQSVFHHWKESVESGAPFDPLDFSDVIHVSFYGHYLEDEDDYVFDYFGHLLTQMLKLDVTGKKLSESPLPQTIGNILKIIDIARQEGKPVLNGPRNVQDPALSHLKYQSISLAYPTSIYGRPILFSSLGLVNT